MTFSHRSARLDVRFGQDIMAAGFTSIPNRLIQNFTRLGITHSEMMFVVVVWYSWWHKDEPYPTLATIAHRLGVSWRQTHRYAKSLENKGFVMITHRANSNGGQDASEYDFGPLLEAVLDLPPDGSVMAPSVRFDRPTPDTHDRGPLSDVSHLKEEEYEEEKEELRVRVTSYIEDFAREFRDTAPLRSSVTRAINIFTQSGLEFGEYRDIMYRARAKTKATAGVQKKMAYFFEILEDLVSSSGSSSVSSSTGKGHEQA